MERYVGVVAVILALSISTLYLGLVATTILSNIYCLEPRNLESQSEVNNVIKELSLAIVGALAGFLGYTIGTKSGNTPTPPPPDQPREDQTDE